MTARFILGRAGTGKTAWCMERTIAACRANPMGEPILWIVPRQATFQVERDFCCTPGLGGFFRVQVVSFELLCRQVLAEVGGAAAADITSAGRQMILGHLLRKHQKRLRYFGAVAAHGGLAAELDSTLDELERGGADVANLVAQLPDPANTALAEKAHDLQLIQEAYTEYLAVNRLDPGKRFRQAMESFAASKLLANASVYVDGFWQLSHRERTLLAAIGAACREIYLALTIDPDSPTARDPHHLPEETSLFHRLETEYRKLYFGLSEAGVKVESPLVLRDARRFQSAGLRAVERWKTAGEMDGVELIEAADMRAEAAAAARQVRDSVRAGWRYRDIAVLVRQLSDYQELIAWAFAEHGIPYFLDLRRTAGHHPLVQFLQAAVRLADQGWSSEAMLSLLKTGLCGWTAQQVDELENHLLAEAHDADFWTAPALWGKWAEPIEILSAPLRRWIAAAAGARPAADFCRAAFELLEAFAIRGAMARWIAEAEKAGKVEQAAEHGQVWAELIGLFDQIAELLGEQKQTFAEFAVMLEGALANFDLAIAPATVDQVLVGQVDRSRPPAVRGVIVLGLGDGQFPLRPPPTTVLSDADRRSLSGIAELEPDARRRALDEELLGYFALTRASEKLVLTRPLVNPGGEKLEASSLWRKFCPMAPTPGFADVATPRELVAGVLKWARSGDTSSAYWPTIYQWLVQRPAREDELDRLRRLAWPALVYTNKAELDADTAAKIFAPPLRVRARQIEAFAACPFQHFVRYGLGLRERTEGGLGAGDAARLSEDVLKSEVDYRRLDPSEVHRRLAERAVKLKGERILAVPRHRHWLQRLESTINQVVAAQVAAARCGKFEPKRVAVWYGDDQKLPAVAAGKGVLIEGVIDRIDVLPGSQAAVAYDYRLKGETLVLVDVYHGLKLELVVHLLALKGASRELPLAAALSAPLSRRIDDGDPAEAPAPGEEGFDLQTKPRGIIVEEFAGDLDGQSDSGWSKAMHVYRNKGGGFGNRHSSDIASREELAGLLSHVRGKLEELAERIVAGEIGIRPYKIGGRTACANCTFAEVCRFEPEQGYAIRTAMKRDEVLRSVSG